MDNRSTQIPIDHSLSSAQSTVPSESGSEVEAIGAQGLHVHKNQTQPVFLFPHSARIKSYVSSEHERYMCESFMFAYR